MRPNVDTILSDRSKFTAIEREFYCDNCKDFRHSQTRDNDICCQHCHWVIATFRDRPKEADPEQTIIETLYSLGAMSPSRLAAKTLIAPGRLKHLLASLWRRRLVLIFSDERTIDGKIVALGIEGVLAAQGAKSPFL